jgi:hypothetical protein
MLERMRRRPLIWLLLAGPAAAALLLTLTFERNLEPAPGPASRTVEDTGTPTSKTPRVATNERREVGAPEFWPEHAVPRSAIPATIPQAEPVALALWAAAARQTDVLRDAWSRSMQQRIDSDRGGWGTFASGLAELLAQRCGPYAACDFTFEFAGDATAGQVTVIHRGAVRLTPLRVTREGDRWLIDER